MKKNELRELATWGARRKVTELEKQLSDLQREFPELFVTKDRPVLLKAELRDEFNGNGRHPNPNRSAKSRAAWTPERRAAQAELMRKVGGVRGHKRKDKKAKRARKVMAATNKKKNTRAKNWKGQWHARLAEHGPERIGVSAKALGATAASLLTSGRSYLKNGVIKKTKESGTYAVGATAPDAVVPAPK